MRVGRTEPANGRCICDIVAQFEAEYGYTVDQYYERNPDAVPWYIERCQGCTEANTAPQVIAEPITVKATPAASVAIPEPSQHDSAGTHFASFPDEPITAQLYQEKPTVMCATYQEKIATNCECAWHDRQIPQTEDAVVNFMAASLGFLACLALVGALIVLAGSFLATLAAVCGALYAAYALRHVALAIALAGLKVITFPFKFFGGMIVDGFAELKAEQAQAQTQPVMIPNTYRVVEPLQLSDQLQPIGFEFGQREPVYVEMPARTTAKSSAKMEAK